MLKKIEKILFEKFQKNEMHYDVKILFKGLNIKKFVNEDGKIHPEVIKECQLIDAIYYDFEKKSLPLKFSFKTF